MLMPKPGAFIYIHFLANICHGLTYLLVFFVFFLRIFVTDLFQTNETPRLVCCSKLFISSGTDPDPGLTVTHLSDTIKHTTHSPLLPCGKREKKGGKKNLWLLINAALQSFTLLFKYCPDCALRCCYGEILLTYHWKARDTILNKQCYPISRNGTLITLCVARIEFFWNVIFKPTLSQWRESEGKEPFINHSLTLLLHYPKLTFSQPLSVSHQNSIIPVKAVWIVG